MFQMNLVFILGKKLGPFYGPNAMDKVCGQNTAKSIKISYHDKNISEMVKICKGQSFSQHCDYLEVGVSNIL